MNEETKAEVESVPAKTFQFVKAHRKTGLTTGSKKWMTVADKDKANEKDNKFEWI